MSDSFDAYHKWLGIPAADQPADAYRLLGVPRYESDPEVIASAADRQMAHVKAQASGPHAKLSQKMLNQLSKARTCLLNAEQKLQYDETLRQQEASAKRRAGALATALRAPAKPAAKRPSTASSSAAADAFTGPINTSTHPQSTIKRAGWTGPRELSLKTRILGHVIAPLVGLILGYVVLCWLAPSQDVFHLFSEPAEETDLDGGESPAPKFVALDDEHEEHAGMDSPPQVAVQPTEPVAPAAPPPDEAPQPVPAVEIPPLPDEQPVEPELPSVVRQPFAELAAHVELPSVGNREPVSLGAIFVPPGENLQLELRTAPLVAKANDRFAMHQAGSADDTAAVESWIVSLISEIDSGSSGADEVAVARFFFQDQSLNFQWSSHAASGAATQLRNCLLEASVGEEAHALALREPQQLPPAVLHMEETTSRIVFQVPDCPAKDRIYLRLQPESQLGPVQNHDAATALIKLGERIELRYQPATLTVRLADRRSELAIEVAGEYTIGGREYPLSTERLKKHALGSQKQLTDYLAEGRRREADAYRLDQQIASLASRYFPNSPSGLIARRKRDQQLASLRSDAARNSKRIALLKKRVPVLQATLQEMPGIVALTNTLRNGRKIHYRVMLMLDNHEIDLAASSDDVQQVPTIQSPSAEPSGPSRRVKAAMETLKENPDDPAANLLVGSYYCLEENDWSKGAPLLARSGDDKLAAVVELDRAAPTDLDARIALADAWFDLATGDRTKRGFLARAAYWYRQSQADATGLTRLKIEKRLDTVNETTTGP